MDTNTPIMQACRVGKRCHHCIMTLMRITHFLFALLVLVQPACALAAEDNKSAFSDITPGAWYEPAATRFASLGYFANPKPLAAMILVGTNVFPTPSNHFQPEKSVLRSELVSLVAQTKGGISDINPTTATFDDVATSSPSFRFFEHAAANGWTRGKDGCAGTHPCMAFPDAKLTRGEAAAFIARAFELTPTGTGKQFADNAKGAWYFDAVQTLVDRCILQGDDGHDTVRPLSTLNRAEMAAILDRAQSPGVYGKNCGIIEYPAYVKSVTRVAPTVLRIQASLLLKKSSATDVDNYDISSTKRLATPVKVLLAKLVNPMTVELTLNQDLEDNTIYMLSVSKLETNRHVTLNDQMTFQRLTSSSK